MNKLLKHNINRRIWWSIKKYYDTTEAYVENNGEFSNKFKTSVGVKQGGPMSPKLFAIYIDEMLEMISKLEGGCHINKINLSIVAYADDTILLFESKKALQEAINMVEKYCSKHAIKINGKKSQFIIFSKTKCNATSQSNIIVNDTLISRVNHIKYLGVILSDTLNVELHLKPRKDKYLKATYGLGNVGISNDNINAMLKGFLMKTYCTPVLLYGIEVMPITLTQLNSLKSTITLSIKRLLKIEKLASTTKLLYALKIEPTDRQIMRRKLNTIYQLYINPVTQKIMNEMGKIINNSIINNKNIPNKSIVLDTINILEQKSYEPNNMLTKCKEVTTWIQTENKLMERDDEIIEIRRLITVPTLENWAELNNQLRPEAVERWRTEQNNSIGA